MRERCLSYQFVADKDVADVLDVFPAIFGDEGEEPLLGFVVSAVGDLVERVLVQHLFCLGLLHDDALRRDG